MPKSRKRLSYLQRRARKIKQKDGDRTKTPIENDLNAFDNSRKKSDVTAVPNGINPERKSHTPDDVEIIDGQPPKGDNAPASTASHAHNDENMNDNMTYPMRDNDERTRRLFDRIRYSEDAVSTLPNRSWAIHCTELPLKRIVVSEMIMHNGDGGWEPFYVKQIIFDEKLGFEVFLLNSRTVLKDMPSSIHSLESFEALLDHVQGLKLCRGGPNYQKYSHITPECAYKDSINKWRHNLCSLEVNDCDICESCLSLDEILKRHAQRVKPSVKQKNGIGMMQKKRPGQSKDT